MTLYVIRHASAGPRGPWGADDLERPLDATGHEQARAIAESLGDEAVTRLLSSEAVRCLQTLAPLSAGLGLPVEPHPALFEGSRAIDTVELLRAMALIDGAVALCSHGDVIPSAVSKLAREGMVLIGGRGCEKGSIWELEVRGRDIVSGRYRPPSSLRDLTST